MKFPSFEHFAIDACEFFSWLGIVFEPATEDRWNCESITEADKVILLGHVGERNRTQQSVTDRKNTKNQDVLLFAVSIAKEMAVDCSTLYLYLKHIQDSCGGLSAIVLFHYENTKYLGEDANGKYIALGTVDVQNSGSTKSALIPHVSLFSPSRGHILALEYIQKQIQKIPVESYNAFRECWYELFFEKKIINHITKNILYDIQDWYQSSLQGILSDKDRIVHTQNVQMVVQHLLICILTCWYIKQGSRFTEYAFLQNRASFRSTKTFLECVKQRVPYLYSMLFDDEIQKDTLHSDPLFFDNLEYFRLIDILQSYPFSARENTIYPTGNFIESCIFRTCV